MYAAIPSAWLGQACGYTMLMHTASHYHPTVREAGHDAAQSELLRTWMCCDRLPR